MEERQRAARLAELGIDAAEFAGWQGQLSDGLLEALAAGVVRFEDALLELDR